MWMMLRVIPIMWRAVRPSRVVDMPAVVNTFWLPKGYEGLTFFGHILAPTQELADRFNSAPCVAASPGVAADLQSAALKNHEMIHLRQAQACGDSWLHFYLLYIWYWAKNRVSLTFCSGGSAIRRQMKHAAYLLNPFEIEAYARMNDLNYLKGDCKSPATATEWRRYAKMPLKERLRLYRKDVV